MPIGDLDELIHTAVPRERPFEGVAAASDEESGGLFAIYLYPELAPWLPLLARLSVPIGEAAYIAALTRKNKTDFQSELLASGLVVEDRFCQAFAAELGIGMRRPSIRRG